MNIKLTAAVLAGALGLTATGAYAAGCPMAGPGFHGQYRQTPQECFEGRMAALESVLTVKDNQKDTFKAYTDAKMKWFDVKYVAKEKTFDEQTRLEAKAKRMKSATAALEDVVAKRAALWKVLDPQQKMVLETYETHGFAGMHRGYHYMDGMKKFHRAAPDCGCPMGMTPQPQPMPGPGFHHPDHPMHY